MTLQFEEAEELERLWRAAKHDEAVEWIEREAGNGQMSQLLRSRRWRDANTACYVVIVALNVLLTLKRPSDVIRLLCSFANVRRQHKDISDTLCDGIYTALNGALDVGMFAPQVAPQLRDCLSGVFYKTNMVADKRHALLSKIANV